MSASIKIYNFKTLTIISIKYKCQMTIHEKLDKLKNFKNIKINK